MAQSPLGDVIPLKIKFEESVATRLKMLLQSTELPPVPPISTTSPWALGVHLPWLSKLKLAFESSEWRVNDLEDRINCWPNYLVRMKATPSTEETEEVELHFIHVRSHKSNAIPLMLLHGWPGTFWDFHKILEPLINPPDGQPAFHVVVPSLPGFFLSTYPQRYDWSVVDTAHLLHRFMTDVLGYTCYAGQGGDWGSYIFRVIGSLYPSQAPVLHFNMFRCPVVPGVDPQSFSAAERNSLDRSEEFWRSGRGYTDLQSTKPFTIGIALSSSPVALLAYLGEKMYAWSDPRTLDPADVIDTVALYYLSGSFATSVMIYHQSRHIRQDMINSELWRMRSKIGFTLFPYEIGASPRAYISAIGPLNFYKERSVGGHFPALDNPEGLIEDIREFIAGHWPR